MTDQDAKNLHVALVAKRLSERPTVWARIDSPPLAQHVTDKSSIQASSPLLLAARAFARKALELRRAREDSKV
jgi:Trk K+ transport system NAD-binding subunit